jgi:calcineurin-like phosphoesterase
MGRVHADDRLPVPLRRRAGGRAPPGDPIIVVDIHAEATSEKVAMGWYLDGRVSAVLGTHTHIQTADERVLPRGTAYLTDVGMTGPYDSVIGVVTEIAIGRFLEQTPRRSPRGGMRARRGPPRHR